MGDAHGIAAKIEKDGADVFKTMEGANCQDRLEITNDNYLRQVEWQAYPQRDSGCGLWWTFTWDPFVPSGASDKARKANTLVLAHPRAPDPLFTLEWASAHPLPHKHIPQKVSPYVSS